MPLCITGMHRSGTSMVARLLNLCGLYLGRDEDLLPAAPDNPEGFWENRHFLRLNDALLGRAGGAWDCPPPPPAGGWETGVAFGRLRRRARKLVDRFRGREPWGWKDPRNCLTLPVWRAAAPGLKTLLCVRHPLAVAESLWARDGMSFAASFELWLAYNRAALAAAPPGCRVVTHYDRYFADPHAELRRVLGLLGLAADGCLARACAAVKPALAHHRVAACDIDPGGSPEVARCYRALCAEAGIPDASYMVREARSVLAPLAPAVVARGRGLTGVEST
jgi:hypothetical protein